MKEWYDLALQLDSQTNGDRYRGNHNHDSNAMDIDAIQMADKKTW